MSPQWDSSGEMDGISWEWWGRSRVAGTAWARGGGWHSQAELCARIFSPLLYSPSSAALSDWNIKAHSSPWFEALNSHFSASNRSWLSPRASRAQLRASRGTQSPESQHTAGVCGVFGLYKSVALRLHTSPWKPRGVSPR